MPGYYEDGDDLPEPEIDFNKEFALLVYKALQQNKVKGGENIIKMMLDANQSFCQEALTICNENNYNTIGFYEEMIRRFQVMRNKL